MIFYPPEPDPALQRRRRRLWILAVVAFVGFAAAAVPLYRSGKLWRARALAADAEHLMDANKRALATEKAQSAFRLAPSEPAALRALARVFPDSAEELWKKLLALPSATLEDRRRAAQLALKTHHLDFAEQQINFLLKAEPAGELTVELAARLATEKHDRASALAYTNQLLTIDPARVDASLSRARLLFNSVDVTERQQGKHALQDLGKRDDASGLEALSTLAASPELSPEELRPLAITLEAHPRARIEHRLTAVSLRIRATPADREALLRRAIAKYRDDGSDAVAALGLWTMQQGEPGSTVELISKAAAQSRRDLFVLRIDALAALNRWKEVQGLLEKEEIPLAPVIRDVFLARASVKLDEPVAASAHWLRALSAARETSELLVYIAQYAEKAGAIDIAEKAWRQLAKDPASKLHAYRGLVSLLQDRADTRALRGALRELIEFTPDDPAARNQRAYLDLLLRENITAAIRTAEELFREHPEELAFRTTLALARLRAGDAAAAHSLYVGISVEWETVPPGWQALRGAVLAANGDTAKAKEIWSTLPTARLKPEERAFIESPR